IDCGFRNPSLLLGLAIWFSKTESLVSTATSCYPAPAFDFLPASAGRPFYFIFAPAVNHPVSAFLLCCSPKSPAPPSGFRCFLSEGRGFYLFAASRVNRCFVDRPAAPARLPLGFLRRGRGFYHRRVSCQLASLTAVFRRCSCSHHEGLRASARLRCGGAACTTDPGNTSTFRDRARRISPPHPVPRRISPGDRSGQPAGRAPAPTLNHRAPSLNPRPRQLSVTAARWESEQGNGPRVPLPPAGKDTRSSCSTDLHGALRRYRTRWSWVPVTPSPLTVSVSSPNCVAWK
ncbi:hypothetical protein SAMN05443572_1171, partial [Myxococcus fulvus]